MEERDGERAERKLSIFGFLAGAYGTSESDRVRRFDLISMVGELQTEDARFNNWCGSAGKFSLEMSDVSRRNREARSLIRRVYEAWASFSETFEAGLRKRSVAVAERSDLKAALTEAIRGLAALREPSP